MTQVARVVALDEISLESNVCNSFPVPVPVPLPLFMSVPIQREWRQQDKFKIFTGMEKVFR